MLLIVSNILVVRLARDAVCHAETLARVSRHCLASSLSTTQDTRAGVHHQPVRLYTRHTHRQTDRHTDTHTAHRTASLL